MTAKDSADTSDAKEHDFLEWTTKWITAGHDEITHRTKNVNSVVREETSLQSLEAAQVQIELPHICQMNFLRRPSRGRLEQPTGLQRVNNSGRIIFKTYSIGKKMIENR